MSDVMWCLSFSAWLTCPLVSNHVSDISILSHPSPVGRSLYTFSINNQLGDIIFSLLRIFSGFMMRSISINVEAFLVVSGFILVSGFCNKYIQKWDCNHVKRNYLVKQILQNITEKNISFSWDSPEKDHTLFPLCVYSWICFSPHFHSLGITTRVSWLKKNEFKPQTKEYHSPSNNLITQKCFLAKRSF